jgi:hypothetical protein
MGRLSSKPSFFRKQALNIEPVAAWRQGVALTEIDDPHAVPVVLVVCLGIRWSA